MFPPRKSRGINNSSSSPKKKSLSKIELGQTLTIKFSIEWLEGI
jgi:hypothetical protein